MANKNDTDVSDKIDNAETSVESEVDLLKMIIRKPSRAGADDLLTLTKISGNAKVWTTSNKGTGGSNLSV